MTQSAYSNTTEAVGIFHTAEDLQAAIDDLLTQGFNRMDLSILASERAIEDKLHEAYVPARDLEDRVEVPTTAFVSTESVGDAMGAVIGVLLAVAVAAVVVERRRRRGNSGLGGAPGGRPAAKPNPTYTAGPRPPPPTRAPPERSTASVQRRAVVWESLRDPATGDTYYVNEVTGESTWDRPLELVVEEGGV